MTKQYLRPDEVATILACSTRHVRRLCERGELHAFRIGNGPGGPIRIRRDSLETFVHDMRLRYEEENGICDLGDAGDQAEW